ncbi:MAG: AIR synthase-related protein, partial [Chloroflexota bacterium]
ACRALELPVISGNVSLYNETQGEAVYPTPVIGVLGLLERAHRRCTMGFKGEGDLVYLLGPLTSAPADLAGSEYLEQVHGLVQGRPAISLETERGVQRACLDGIRAGVIRSAHDCSEGGLAVALAESAIAGGLGVRIEARVDGRWDAVLFGEPPSRIVVSLAPEDAPRLAGLARRHGAPLHRLGVVEGRRLAWADLLNEPVSRLADAWRHGLERAAQ